MITQKKTFTGLVFISVPLKIPNKIKNRDLSYENKHFVNFVRPAWFVFKVFLLHPILKWSDRVYFPSNWSIDFQANRLIEKICFRQEFFQCHVWSPWLLVVEDWRVEFNHVAWNNIHCIFKSTNYHALFHYWLSRELIYFR